MKNIIITGAGGMVGRIILRECLESSSVNKIISFVRKASGIIHEKLTEIIISDFSDFTGKEEYFKNADAAFFCIGVYTGAVPDSEFKKITVDYTVAFAKELKKHSPNVNFCFLSGAGADETEKSRMAFAKYKGMAENYLIKTFENLNIFRPGYIYPVEKRKEPNFAYYLMRKLYPVLKLFGKKYSIKSTELGKAIFKSGMMKTGKNILENTDILSLLKQA